MIRAGQIKEVITSSLKLYLAIFSALIKGPILPPFFTPSNPLHSNYFH